MPIRAVTTISPDDVDLSADMLVAAIASTRACFVCDDPTHLLGECPRLKKLKENPGACRLLLRHLDPAPPSASPSTKCVRMLLDGSPGEQARTDEAGEDAGSGEDDGGNNSPHNDANKSSLDIVELAPDDEPDFQ